MSGMTAGKLSKPVKTSNGYALVRLERKSIPEGFDPNAVKGMVAPQLLQAKHQQLFTEYFQSLRNVEDLRP
jgi:peptidylprolyl isomerase/peptidyl-prolyl cis-trans isomerase D